MTETQIAQQLVDPDKLHDYLKDRLEGDGPFDVSRHIAGHSNETFFISRGEYRWVLRRPPAAVYLPTAHDVLREHRVLSALAATSVRAPRVVLACEDAAVIGAPFYVMERVEGAVIRDAVPDPVDDPANRQLIGEELVRALVELHAVDFLEVGLEGFGKPAGYLERQIRRWSGQLELATSITAAQRPVPRMWEVREWLASSIPPSGDPVVVHGDYKLDNVMFAPGAPARLVSIFDWEMATLGDPLADLGWLVSFWRQADDPQEAFEGDLPRVTQAPGFMTRAELIDLYSSLSGRSVGDLRWYVVAAVWKLACLLEGSYGRHLLVTTDDPFFARLGEGIPALARRALDIAQGAGGSGGLGGVAATHGYDPGTPEAANPPKST